MGTPKHLRHGFGKSDGAVTVMVGENTYKTRSSQLIQWQDKA